MIQDIEPKQYDITYQDIQAREQDYIFPFYGEKLLVKSLGEEKGNIVFLTFDEFSSYGFDMDMLKEHSRYAFKIDKEHFFFIMLDKVFESKATRFYEDIDAAEVETEEDNQQLVWLEQPAFRTLDDLWKCFAGVTAIQINRWYRSRQYCGRCGQPFEHSGYERAMKCKNCGIVEYPKICPAVIVGVVNEEKLLLTRYADRPYKRYALIAGFGEVGESLEATVRREVFEEVGLRVKNITYYKSQPWSFSDSLLCGFFVELEGSDKVVLQESELAEGKWFEREDIPEPDVGIALTAEMIKYFKDGNNPFK